MYVRKTEQTFIEQKGSSKTKKKLIAIVLALTILAGMFAGCAALRGGVGYACIPTAPISIVTQYDKRKRDDVESVLNVCEKRGIGNREQGTGNRNGC